MPKIVIPTALRQYAGNTAAVDVQGATAGEVLASLTTQHPELKKHLYDANGKLRSFVNVFVNDEDIRGLQNENTPVKESDDVSIIPAIAGGAGAEARTASSLPEWPIRFVRFAATVRARTAGRRDGCRPGCSSICRRSRAPARWRAQDSLPLRPAPKSGQKGASCDHRITRAKCARWESAV